MVDDEISKKVSDDIDPTTGNFKKHNEEEPSESLIDEEISKLHKLFSDTPDLIDILQQVSQKDGRLPEESVKALENAKKWVKDIEYLCRHAYIARADNIIFLDKSARPDAALVKRILPIVKLEYCQANNLSPNSVEEPTLLFINPAEKAGLRNAEQFVKDYSEKLAGSRNIVYDESSIRGEVDASLNEYISQKMSPNDQYTIFRVIDGIVNEVIERKGYLDLFDATNLAEAQLDSLFPGERIQLFNDGIIGLLKRRSVETGKLPGNTREVYADMPSATWLASDMAKLVPQASFETHIGSSETRGGFGISLMHYIYKNRDIMPRYVADPDDESNDSVRDPNTTHEDIKEGFKIIKSVAKLSYDDVFPN